MSLKYLISFVAISGIFRKSDDKLDILPPPPPFPELEKENERIKEKGRIRERGKKQKEKERDQRRILEERVKKAKLKEEKKKEGRKKTFEFFHGLGLVKTEKEKKEIERKKEEERRKQIELRLKAKEGGREEELERGRHEEEKRKKKEEERKRAEKEKLKLEEKKPEKETIFRKIFGGKKDEIDVSEELKSIEKITPKPLKERKREVAETKLEMPELRIPEIDQFGKETAELEEVIKAKEEIQKAIGSVKEVKKKPSIMKGLFKKREKPAEEKVEMPEVMPRVEGKEDSIELIEEKMHKARLALMEFKFDEAKRVYVEIMKMYNELDPKKKLKVYQDIKDLYYERKTAEKFAK